MSGLSDLVRRALAARGHGPAGNIGRAVAAKLATRPLLARALRGVERARVARGLVLLCEREARQTAQQGASS